MEQYATKEATVAALESLGFVRVVPKELFFDSPKNDAYGMPVVQAYVYQCRNRYWCVALDGDYDYKAPIVWDGPRAEWDKSDTTVDFVKWLDKHYSGWR